MLPHRHSRRTLFPLIFSCRSFVNVIAMLSSTKSSLVLLIVLGLFSSDVFAAPVQPNMVSLYNSNDKVVILVAKNFSSTVYQSETAWLVEFYASWCGHCQRYAKVERRIFSLPRQDEFFFRPTEKSALTRGVTDRSTMKTRRYVIFVSAWKSVVRVGAINCHDEQNNAICDQHGVRAYPTLRVKRTETMNSFSASSIF